MLLLPYFKAHNNTGSILDIGCGVGDVLTLLDHLAKKDNISLSLQGIDPDSHAYEYIQKNNLNNNINFTLSTLEQLLASARKYDFIISNNLVHHLDPDTLKIILKQAMICSGISRYRSLSTAC
jgi:2-polyprenyl-3-methyl-5-hydroxy-6-metoxy-1,4-benzoquinol methylase